MILDDVRVEHLAGDRARVQYRGTVCTVQPNPRRLEAKADLARAFRVEAMAGDRTAAKVAADAVQSARRRVEGTDSYQYTLPNGETYSHPTLRGALHLCRRYYVEAGLIRVPVDNSHLDEIDRGIAFKLEMARSGMAGPRVGDLVHLTGQAEPVTRICGFSFDGRRFGLSHGGSYALPARKIKPGNAGASYSGGLDWRPEWTLARLVDTGRDDARARFWFFSHGVPGAGCGVDVALPARVYRLADLDGESVE